MYHAKDRERCRSASELLTAKPWPGIDETETLSYLLPSPIMTGGSGTVQFVEHCSKDQIRCGAGLKGTLALTPDMGAV